MANVFPIGLLITLVTLPQITPVIYLVAAGDLSIFQGLGALVAIPFSLIVTKRII